MKMIACKKMKTCMYDGQIMRKDNSLSCYWMMRVRQQLVVNFLYSHMEKYVLYPNTVVIQNQVESAGENF